MALGTPATSPGQQGQTTMRPNGLLRLQFAGDSAYPTGGTLEFAETYLRAELSRDVEVTQVFGYGKTAGAITHIADYDAANDALQAFVLAGTEVPNATNLSSVTFDVIVAYR